VNTNAQIMAWMMDTYSMNQGQTATGVVTGKPITLGGSLGRREATGRGVFVVGCEAARRIGMDIEGARIAVQGFGNVGGIAARLYQEAGAKVVAVQDHTGTLYKASGIDAVALLEHVAKHGGVGGYAEADTIANEDFWTEDEINERLERVMREAFAAVWQVASEQKVSVRTAAFIVACKRILQAREMRGLYP
jgi:glutamate dehydrogenase (NAD(P)+)